MGYFFDRMLCTPEPLSSKTISWLLIYHALISWWVVLRKSVFEFCYEVSVAQLRRGLVYSSLCSLTGRFLWLFLPHEAISRLVSIERAFEEDAFLCLVLCRGGKNERLPLNGLICLRWFQIHSRCSSVQRLACLVLQVWHAGGDNLLRLLLNLVSLFWIMGLTLLYWQVFLLFSHLE